MIPDCATRRLALNMRGFSSLMHPEPRGQQLYYYTSQLEFLISALKDGFWPRYCEEDLSSLLAEHMGEGFWIAFPMVCFTDMPPRTAHDHRERYGDYAIAVNKDAASEYDLVPVIYLFQDSSVARHIAEILRPGRGRVQLDPKHNNPMRPIIPFIKMTPGTQTDRAPGRGHAWEGLAFEEEMEWRYIAPDPAHWPEGRWRGFVKKEDHDLTANYRLKMEPIYIERVVVPKIGDVRAVAKAAPQFSDRIYLRMFGGALRKIPHWVTKAMVWLR